MAEATQESGNRFGDCLRAWRQRRRLSQLDLGLEARVSARHICFLENGRARPSREMVLRLLDTLDLPLRERNDVLLAAGFAPHYPEHRLDGPELDEARKALGFVLEAHAPYPAFVLDRTWQLVLWNAPQAAMLRDTGVHATEPSDVNVLELVFRPGPVRDSLINWDEVATAVLRRLRRQIARFGPDDPLNDAHDELLGYPGVRDLEGDPRFEQPAPVLTPMRVRRGQDELTWYSTLAIFGATGDVTLEELVIESFFPGDEATRAYVARVAAAASAPD